MATGMNERHLHSIGVYSDLLAIRKAAVMAHWVKGLSLMLLRSSRPTLLVTVDEQLTTTGRHLRMHPCDFRREVGLLMGSESAILGSTSDLGRGNMQLEIITCEKARFEDAGLVGTGFDDHHSMVGFVTTTSAVEDLRHQNHKTCEWDLSKPPPLLLNVDDELELTMVTCSYFTEDVQRAELAYSAVFDAMITASAEEFATAVSS